MKPRIADWLLALSLAMGGCADEHVEEPFVADQLVGSWQSPDEPADRITYHANGTFEQTFLVGEAGEERTAVARGTWEIVDGAIHNVSTWDNFDEVDPELAEFIREEFGADHVSVEKLVDVGDQEYRYVCPIMGTTNTLVRAADE